MQQACSWASLQFEASGAEHIGLYLPRAERVGLDLLSLASHSSPGPQLLILTSGSQLPK